MNTEMEEILNPEPETADSTAPEGVRLWDLDQDGDVLHAKDPAGWWTASLHEPSGLVTITKYANHSLLNRPAGQIDSADATFEAPLGELIDRLIELDDPYSPGPIESEIGSTALQVCGLLGIDPSDPEADPVEALESLIAQKEETEGTLASQRTAAETFYAAAKEQKDGDAARIAVLELEISALKTAPAPTYGEEDARSYAEGHGLALIDAKELEELRTLATDGRAAGEKPAAKKAKGTDGS